MLVKRIITELGRLPQVLSISGYVGRFACVLNFGDVPPAIGLATV